MDKKTPLYPCHVAAGGKIVPFGGYLLPVQYETGIIKEHMAVREKAGLFDVSHMGEVLFEGPDALSNLNRLLTNSFDSMADGGVRYSPMCNDSGGVVDDLIVYRFTKDKYMAVVNAANRDKDVAWMREHLTGDLRFSDISDSIAQVALQGPLAPQILAELADVEALPRKYYTFAPEVSVGGIPCTVSRTGYTGSDGYELYTAAEHGPALWNKLLEAGAPHGLIPCGLGARDTLRLEAGMPLYGHEMDDAISPLETSLGFAVKMNKADFIGKQALIDRGEPTVTRVGLKALGRGIVREHAALFADGEEIGHSTSGTHCPYLGYAVAMALVDKAYSAIGTKMEAEVRGRRIEMEVVALPFYKK